MRLTETLRSHPRLNTALGVGFAAVAALLMLGYVSRLIGGGSGRIDIAVASRDVEVGTVVTPDMVAVVQTPERYAVPGSIRSGGKVAGSRAVRFIGRGEPFTESSVSGAGEDRTLAARIPPDLRAYALQVSRGRGAGTLLRAGDRVDVLATSGDPPRTSTILKERLVLSAVGGAAGGEGQETDGLLDVTLLVSPAEAELLAQAGCEGEISVTLCPLSGKGANTSK